MRLVTLFNLKLVCSLYTPFKWYIDYTRGCTMKEIELTRGCFAIVDDEDYAKFGRYSWHCTIHGYAARREIGTHIHRYLHRDIMDAVKGQVIDHINGNQLDNRKENLRFCTQLENVWNTRRKPGSTGFIGVYDSSSHCIKKGYVLKKKYATRITVEGRELWLGRYETPEEASKVYQEALIKYRGKFAPKNTHLGQRKEQ